MPKNTSALNALFLVSEVTVLAIYAFCTEYKDGIVNTGTDQASFD